MDFAEHIEKLAKRIETQRSALTNEEATKTALIMPFLQALGYDVFNPTEVMPEFTADVGTKKGEKVDYAIMRSGAPEILIECKQCGSNLDINHASQLFRYFSTTRAHFAILTNGVVYQFFSDLDEKNKMDSQPFFEFDCEKYDENDIRELRKFSKATFDLESILNTANSLKYTTLMANYLVSQSVEPSEDFVRFVGGQVYSGRMTSNIVEQFTGLAKTAFLQLIRQQVNDRLQSALRSQEESINNGLVSTVEEVSGIETTDEELNGYNIVRAICASVLSVDRIYMRDSKSYCAILLDDNNRKPIARLHFNRAQKYLGVFDGKSETRHPIERVEEIFSFQKDILATVQQYE